MIKGIDMNRLEQSDIMFIVMVFFFFNEEEEEEKD